MTGRRRTPCCAHCSGIQRACAWNGEHYDACRRCADEGRSQRQDSLYDQIVDVLTWARENGCYDAYDWIADRFADSDWSLLDGHLRPPDDASLWGDGTFDGQPICSCSTPAHTHTVKAHEPSDDASSQTSTARGS